jgi:hypothetical protein
MCCIFSAIIVPPIVSRNHQRNHVCLARFLDILALCHLAGSNELCDFRVFWNSHLLHIDSCRERKTTI